MIDEIIKKKDLTPKDCTYHTLRSLENNGKIRCLVIKGEDIVHVDYTCPKCGHSGYKTQEFKKVSKAAKIRFVVECDKCKFKIKVGKLKGKR
jgi:hypothetical protein